MEIEYHLRPWPNLEPWLQGLTVLLTGAAAWEAWMSGRRWLLVVWALLMPVVLLVVLAPPESVGGLVQSALPTGLPLSMAGVLGLLMYMGLRSYSRSTRRLSWVKLLWLMLVRTAALLLGFCLLVRPSFSWTEETVRFGAVWWIFDVSGSMYDATDVPDLSDTARASTGEQWRGDDGQPLSRAEAVDQLLRRHAETIAKLAPRDPSGRPNLRVFIFAEGLREIAPEALLQGRVYADYPGGYAEYKAALAKLGPEARRRSTGVGGLLGRASTAYGANLQAVARMGAAERFSAVVLVGDGIDNAGGEPPELAARRFRDLGINGARLHTLCVGRPSVRIVERNILADPIKLPPEVSLDSEVAVSSKFTFHGLGGRRATVVFLANGKVVGEPATVDIPLGSSVFTYPISRKWKAIKPGQHELSLRAVVAADPPEPSGRNRPDRLKSDVAREVSGQIRVDKAEIRVLYVDRIRTESRFVAEALARATDFRVDRLILTDRVAATGRNGLPTDLAGWLAYDVILLGDIPVDWFSPGQQTLLATAVREHARGLLTMGGYRALGAGGYTDDGLHPPSPVASLLPIRARASDGHVEGAVRLIPTREGLRDGPCALLVDPVGTRTTGNAGHDHAWEQDNFRLWRETLPSLDGANRIFYIRPREDGRPETRFNSIRDGCTVFAVSATDPEQALLVGGRRGAGRVLTLAVDTTWKWVLRPGTDEQVLRSTDLHHRFWRQMVAWLVVPRPDVSFRLESEPTFLLSRMGDARPRVRAIPRNFSPQQLRELRMSVELERMHDGSDSESPSDMYPPGATAMEMGTPGTGTSAGTPAVVGRFPLPRTEAGWTAELSADWTVGRYRAVLKLDGIPTELKLPEEPAVTFRIEDRDLERSDLAARPEAMRSWAVLADERTGEGQPGDGRAFTVDQFDQLLRTLQAARVEQKTTVRNTRDLLSPESLAANLTLGEGLPTGPWVLLFGCVALLMSEWFFRKLWGLV